MLDYHQLHVGTDPVATGRARNQQFLIVTVIGTFTIIHWLISSGALLSVKVERGMFPGGTFYYKFTQRDYAASVSLLDHIAYTDLNMTKSKYDYNNTMFTFYLDDPNVISDGRKQRFAVGYMQTASADPKLAAARKRTILAINDQLVEHSLSEEAKVTMPAWQLWTELPYELPAPSLPAVPAAVIRDFPYNGGFTSSLVYSWKIIPTLRKIVAKEYSVDPPDCVVVISTCDERAMTCTFYTPLSKAKKFLLGHEPMAKYVKTLPVPVPVLVKVLRSLQQKVGRAANAVVSVFRGPSTDEL
jgi:hypothetical protein